MVHCGIGTVIIPANCGISVLYVPSAYHHSYLIPTGTGIVFITLIYLVRLTHSLYSLYSIKDWSLLAIVAHQGAVRYKFTFGTLQHSSD